MTSSTAEIGFGKLTQDVLAFDLRGFRPAQVEFGGMGASSRWQLNHQGTMAEVTADPAGKLSLDLPAEASVNLTRTH